MFPLAWEQPLCDRRAQLARLSSGLADEATFDRRRPQGSFQGWRPAKCRYFAYNGSLVANFVVVSEGGTISRRYQ
jgi:hypothetical protein